MEDAFKFSDFINDELWVLLRWVEVGNPINQQRSGQNNKCCFEFFQVQKALAFIKKSRRVQTNVQNNKWKLICALL
jgi:hypothetical protein